MSRLTHRLSVVSRALQRRAASGPRSAPASPSRILIAHQLLLGDTLMTTGLVAALRRRFPTADIAMAMPPAFLPLYKARPFGLRALAFRPDRPETFQALRAEAPFDWALLPGDNRFSWLCQALDAHWITGWAADQPVTKNWLVDDARAWPGQPASLVDLWADWVADDGATLPSFAPDDWPAPAAADFNRPTAPYVVLHVGASNPRKFWPAGHWQSLGESLEKQGYRIVLSGGKGEEALAKACNPSGRWHNLSGQLDLAQMWHLVQGAAVLVAPDTGIAHLAKLTGTPTVALFGAGPTPLYARGRYFGGQPFHCLVLSELPARPQNTLFKRGFSWLPAVSSQRHAGPDIHYGSGADFVLELARSLLVNR